jgi:formate-dependent phosphoribosylglycinamide formyltransferase (GAR transformylase)
MKKRILLIGSSFSAAPIFHVLSKKDFIVEVCGKAKTDPCHQYADTSHFIDYSNKDELISLIEKEGFDYIVPSCNDYAYISATHAAAQFNYPGFDNVETMHILHNKQAFRRFTSTHQLKVPQYVEINEINVATALDIRLPVLVKPVDSFSGRGVTKVTDSAQVSIAIDLAISSSRGKQAIIEEFVEGDLFSHTAFIKDGEIVFDTFVDEYCTVYPYQVNCSNHPSKLSGELKQIVRAEMTKLIQLLSVADGLLHTQFICNGADFWVIECMRRCPGDLYGQLITESIGLNYIECYIQPFIDETITPKFPALSPKWTGRHTISTKESGIYSSYSCDIKAKEVKHVMLKTSGEKFVEAPYDKLAILFAEFESKEDMFKQTPLFANYIHINKH